MAYEYLLDFMMLPAGAIVNGQAINATGLTFASPSGGIQVAATGGLIAGTAGTDAYVYIVLPEDTDPANLDWGICVEFEHNGDTTNYNQVRYIGRKSVPGTADDAAITNEFNSGTYWQTVARSGVTYFEGGRAPNNTWQTMRCVSGKKYYGFANGCAGAACQSGVISADGGPVYTNTTGTNPYTNTTRHAFESQPYTFNNDGAQNDDPAFLRMRAIKFRLRSVTDKIRRIWVRSGGIHQTVGDWIGPRICNVSSKVVGSSGTEAAAWIRFAAVNQKAALLTAHANDSSEWANGHFDNSGQGQAFGDLVAAGYTLLTLRGTSDTNGGTTYTNREACDWGAPSPGGTFRDALITWYKTLYPAAKWGAVGTSMGGATVLGRQLRNATWYAAALLSAVTNIDHANANGFSTKVTAAYQDQGSWSTIKNTYDPTLRVADLSSVPVLAMADTGDTTILTGNQSQNFVTLLGQKGGIGTFTNKAGAGHLGIPVFDSAALVAFFDGWLTTQDFTIRAAAESVALPTNGQGTLVVNLNRLNGHNAAITMSVSGLPAGISSSWNASPTTANSATLTLTGNGTTPTGTSTITISAVQGGNTRTYQVTLNVNAATPDTTPPVLASGAILPDGQTLELNWTELGSAPLQPATGMQGVTLYIDGAPRLVGEGTRLTNTTTRHILTSLVYQGQGALAGYDPATGNITDSALNEAAAAAGVVITNNSVQAPPTSAIAYNRGPLYLRRPSVDDWEVLECYAGDVFQVDCNLRFADNTIPNLAGSTISALVTNRAGTAVGTPPAVQVIDAANATVRVTLNAFHTGTAQRVRLTVKRTANVTLDDQTFGNVELLVKAR